MKKIIMITALTLLLFSMANAQTQSFRSIALGTIIDDDLDLVYDPIELKFVEGSRLYTNLSNLTSSNENVFDNITDDTYLIGFSGKCPFVENLWRAVLIKFENSLTPLSVGIDSDLNGSNDIWGEGTLIDEYTSYLDTSGNDIYDTIRKISQERGNFYENNSLDFVLNNTYDLGSMVLGARLKLSQDYSDHSEDYLMNYTRFLIDDNYDDLMETGFEDYNNIHDNSMFDILTSILFPDMNGYEVRGDINFLSMDHSTKFNYNEKGTTNNFDPEITDYEDSYVEEEDVQNLNEIKENRFVLGGSLRKTFNKAAERKNDGYWKIGAAINFGSGDYTNSEEETLTSTETFFDGLDTLLVDYVETFKDNEKITDDGTQKTFGYRISGKLNYPLDEKIYFGIGGTLYYDQLIRETNYEESIVNIEDYELVDDDSTAADYVITETYGLSADRTYEKFQTTLIFPVGIEYQFTNNGKWDARFGTIFTNVYTTNNDAKQITDSKPYVTEIAYGDGEVEIDTENNIYESTSEHSKTTTSTTDFYYGLGFKPTDKMQIDLLGFFKVDYATLQDFIQGLRLSFTLKF